MGYLIVSIILILAINKLLNDYKLSCIETMDIYNKLNIIVNQYNDKKRGGELIGH
jgi:hypothetical protein